MKPFKNLVGAVRDMFLPSAVNSMSLPREFLRYGNRNLISDWGQVSMSDADFYTGYSYAMITKRGNKVARTAIKEVSTQHSMSSSDKDKKIVHPYLELIQGSTLFSQYSFWRDISIFLDLEGVYYLMAVRGTGSDVVGDVKYFKLLNPYHIVPVYKKGEDEISGYVETRHGQVRTIPPEMIIQIKELNPFDDRKPFSMTDAAKESQFTIKTAENYTRQAIKHNINAPGIMSTGIQLNEEDFATFRKRITNHTKGEPVFANGAGSVVWEAMQNQLKDSDLGTIAEVNRDTLFAVGGVSKTTMGIEQSGTTRETARVQKELSMEDHVLPRIQLIIDALNLDFKLRYPKDYSKSHMHLIVSNPLAIDYEAQIKKASASSQKLRLYVQLLQYGVDPTVASDYVEGRVNIDAVNIDPEILSVTAEPADTDDAENHLHTHALPNPIVQQEGFLKNAIVQIESRIAGEIINNVNLVLAKNQLDEESDVISQASKDALAVELALIFAGFYGVVFSMRGGATIQERLKEFGLISTFRIDRQAQRWIKDMSKRAATSHVSTVVNDLFAVARKAAMAGQSREDIVSLLTTKYSESVSQNRATAIARSETNRAFTRAQWEADRQFIAQNKLTKRAYKEWITRSDNPCPFCKALEAEGEVPFDRPFKALGTSISAEVDGKSYELNVDYEELMAGNAHTNCACAYRLIIRPE